MRFFTASQGRGREERMIILKFNEGFMKYLQNNLPRYTVTAAAAAACYEQPTLMMTMTICNRKRRRRAEEREREREK
jgi:hypothetical protein